MRAVRITHQPLQRFTIGQQNRGKGSPVKWRVANTQLKQGVNER